MDALRLQLQQQSAPKCVTPRAGEILKFAHRARDSSGIETVLAAENRLPRSCPAPKDFQVNDTPHHNLAYVALTVRTADVRSQ